MVHLKKKNWPLGRRQSLTRIKNNCQNFMSSFHRQEATRPLTEILDVEREAAQLLNYVHKELKQQSSSMLAGNVLVACQWTSTD